MPLMRPEVQAVLREAGLVKKAGEGTISDKFAQAGLSDDEIAERYAELANSGNESIRLKALDSAAKIRGALKEAPPQAPSFTIVIQSASGGEAARVDAQRNDILFPRQSLSQESKEN